MVKDTIQSVKVAEQDAIKLAKDTSEKQEKMLKDAKAEVVMQKEKLATELLNSKRKAIEEAEQHNEARMEQAVTEAKEEALLLQKQANTLQEDVFQLILKELTQ